MNIRLGNYRSDALPSRTPTLNIIYHAKGIDAPAPQRVQKMTKKMREKKVAEWIVTQFEAWAPLLPDYLGTWIDEAYTARMKDWQDCIGARLPNGVTITTQGLAQAAASRLRIIMHPKPFPVSMRGNALTCGVAYVDRIEVVGAYLSHNNTWLRRCDHLIEWEIGNWIGMQFSYAPQDVNQEIGNKKPCR